MNQNAERFAEYVQNREEPPPRLLFKYTTLDTARLIVENRRVRFHSPLEFNDPFDAQWNVLWQLNSPEFHRAVLDRIYSDDFDPARVSDPQSRRLIETERAHYKTLTPAERDEYVVNHQRTLDEDIVMPERVSDQLRRLRVFCLSSIPDSIQMWSYYAQHHAGIVLAFDTRVLEDAWKIPIDKVEYATDLPELVDPLKFVDYYVYDEPMPEIDMSRAARYWTLVKAPGWHHEQEWRCAFLADRGDLRLYMDVGFPENALAAVAAGYRTDAQAFVDLAHAVLNVNPHADLFRLARHSSQFALVAGKLPKPIPVSKQDG